MPDGGASQQRLTIDYNSEMVEQVARFPRLRDQALIVGDALRRPAAKRIADLV
jgi:hypothetical protein